MRKAWRIVAIAFLLLALIGVSMFYLRRNQSRNALARYKAELRARGDKLTFAELGFTSSTDPAYVASRSFFATNEFPDYDDQKDIVNDATLMEYVSPGRARVAWRDRLHVQSTNDEEPFLSADWGLFSRNVTSNEFVLIRYREMLVNPPPDSGRIYLDTYDDVVGGPPGPSVRGARHLGQLFLNSAMADLHERNIDGAISNIHSVIGLSKLYRDEPGLLFQLVRVANAHIALAATWEALQSADWNEERLKALQKEWRDIELFNGIERALLRERSEALIMFEKVRNSKPKEWRNMFNGRQYNPDGSVKVGQPTLRGLWDSHVAPVLYVKCYVNSDEAFQLRHLEELIDSLRLLKSGRPWPEIREPLLLQENEDKKEISSESYPRHLMSVLFGTPSLSRQFSRLAEVETERRLAIVAIAIKRYELQHGRPPESLQKLVPSFLESMPIDPMSGRELRYRTTNSIYLLYSVGQDGVDNGADPTPATKDDKPGLWTGKDVVWPIAATDVEAAAAEEAAKAKEKKD